jgi:hypothetical protein
MQYKKKFHPSKIKETTEANKYESTSSYMLNIDYPKKTKQVKLKLPLFPPPRLSPFLLALPTNL